MKPTPPNFQSDKLYRLTEVALRIRTHSSAVKRWVDEGVVKVTHQEPNPNGVGITRWVTGQEAYKLWQYELRYKQERKERRKN